MERPSVLYDRSSRVILLLLSAFVVVLFLERLRQAAALVPLDYNEGWNAYFAQRFYDSGNPYPNANELIANNYPPLWFTVVALAGTFTSSMVAAGRLVAAVGFCLILASCAGIGYGLRGMWGAVAAAATVGVVLGTQANDWIAVADPQLFAEGISAVALYLAIRAREPSDRLYQWALMVAVLAGFFKHNLAALPASLLFAALLDGKRAIARNAVAAAATLAAGYAVCAFIGGADWPRRLASPRTYSYAQVVKATAPFLTANMFGLALAFAGAFSATNGHRRRVLLGYMCFAIPIAIFFSGGAGVAVNIFFDSMIAISVAASLIVGVFGAQSPNEPKRVDTRGLLRIGAWPFALALAAWLFAAGLSGMRDLVHAFNHDPLDARIAQYSSDIEYLRSIDGNAICGQPALCYLAGKKFVYDPFNMGEALATGAIAPGVMLERLRQNDVQVVVTRPAPDTMWGVPAPMRDEMQRDFGVLHSTSLSVFHVRNGAQRVPQRAP